MPLSVVMVGHSASEVITPRRSLAALLVRHFNELGNDTNGDDATNDRFKLKPASRSLLAVPLFLAF
jgi:hypothetical protein